MPNLHFKVLHAARYTFQTTQFLCYKYSASPYFFNSKKPYLIFDPVDYYSVESQTILHFNLEKFKSRKENLFFQCIFWKFCQNFSNNRIFGDFRYNFRKRYHLFNICCGTKSNEQSLQEQINRSREKSDDFFIHLFYYLEI